MKTQHSQEHWRQTRSLVLEAVTKHILWAAPSQLLFAPQSLVTKSLQPEEPGPAAAWLCGSRLYAEGDISVLLFGAVLTHSWIEVPAGPKDSDPWGCGKCPPYLSQLPELRFPFKQS